MMERIVGGLVMAVLWLGIWLSPMLLTMAMSSLVVWGWLGADYLVNHIAMVLILAAGMGSEAKIAGNKSSKAKSPNWA